jgi:response regulator of citrate/malate metabolism
MSLLNDSPCNFQPKHWFYITGEYIMTEQTQSPSRFEDAFSTGDRKIILIVEDEKLVAWDIEQTLRDHDLLREYDFQDIMVSTSVRGARDIIGSLAGQISLVILDLKLEDGDGTVLIDEFMARNIAVLVVTGYSCFKHVQVPVLYKPFSTSALQQAIASLLGSHRP